MFEIIINNYYTNSEQSDTYCGVSHLAICLHTRRCQI